MTMLERGQRLLRAHAVLLRALAGGELRPPPQNLNLDAPASGSQMRGARRGARARGPTRP